MSPFKLGNSFQLFSIPGTLRSGGLSRGPGAGIRTLPGLGTVKGAAMYKTYGRYGKTAQATASSANSTVKRLAAEIAEVGVPARSGFSNTVRGIGRSVRGSSIPMLATLGAVSLGLNAVAGIGRFSGGLLQGLLPSNVYPTTYGQYGFRTAADAGPAGIQGLKFQFRRK